MPIKMVMETQERRVTAILCEPDLCPQVQGVIGQTALLHIIVTGDAPAQGVHSMEAHRSPLPPFPSSWGAPSHSELPSLPFPGRPHRVGPSDNRSRRADSYRGMAFTQ